jgi:hypothetical protein
LADKLAAWLEGYGLLLATQPLEGGALLAALAVLFGLAAWFVARGRAAAAYWCVAGIVLVQLIVSFGEDIDLHVYRIVALAQQLRHGEPSLLLTSPATGEALPIFVYYSFLPYLLPVALNLAGLSAHAAFTVAMAAQFLVMVCGLRALAEQASSGNDGRRNAAYLALILFLTANYVYSLWIARAAFGETMVYCLVPWVTLALWRGRSSVWVATLIALQAASHPVVFPYALGSSLVVAWCLSTATPRDMLRRTVPPLVAALVVTVPFWLPPPLWKDLVRGVLHLGPTFDETFLSIGQLFDRRYERNLGLALPIAFVIVVLGAGPRLPGRAWLLIAAFAACLAVQTEYLRPIVMHIPLLPHTAYIWRLMLPTAFIGAAALLIGGSLLGPRLRLAVPTLTLLSMMSMAIVFIGSEPATIALLAKPSNDQTWFRHDDEDDQAYGRLDFTPNYATLPTHKTDGAVQTVTFAALRTGVAVQAPYVLVPKAPVVLAQYEVDRSPVLPHATREGIVLGPLPPGSIVSVSEGRFTILFALRIASLLLMMAGLVCAAVGLRVRSCAA